MLKLNIYFSFFLLFPFFLFAKISAATVSENKTERIIFTDSINLIRSEIKSYQKANDPISHQWKFRLISFIKKKVGEDNKTVAAILAFPLFGIVGLHRIYLGTKPYVPVVYIASLGGCAGVLPLIDFFAIIFANKETFDRYKENPQVFMWVKQ